jgi:thiol-disulfide isomerase/thioredoxin
MTLAGLIFTGVFSLLNLLLLLLVAHRLRQVAAALPPSRPRPWLPPGTQVPDFEAATIDGETVTLSQLRGKPSIVAFFSVGCEPCREQVPLFAIFVTGDQAPDAAVAVIVGGPDSQGFTEQLAGKAVLVNESPGGAIGQAFHATAFPALYLLDEEGVVTASGPGLGAILGSRDLAPVPR